MQQQQQGGDNDVQVVRQRIEEAHNKNDLDLLDDPLATPILCSFQAIGKTCSLIQGENTFFKCQSCRMVICWRHWGLGEFDKYYCHPKNKFREYLKCNKCHVLYLQGAGHYQNCQGKKNVLQDFHNM